MHDGNGQAPACRLCDMPRCELGGVTSVGPFMLCTTHNRVTRSKAMAARNNHSQRAARIEMTQDEAQAYYKAAGWENDLLHLTLVSAIVSRMCPYLCGTDLSQIDLNRVQIDHVDPTWRPVLGLNARWVCAGCNSSMGRLKARERGERICNRLSETKVERAVLVPPELFPGS